MTERRLDQVKIRRIFPKNKFYARVLLDWKESVDERNFRSILCRALINLRAYPLNIATFTDLKNIRGIGDQIARKLEEAWNVFCSQNLAIPTLKQIEQMEKGDFLQFLNCSNFPEQKRRRAETLLADCSDPVKSKSAKFSAIHVDVDAENVKPTHGRNHVQKCHVKASQKPLQLSKKAAVVRGNSMSFLTAAEVESNCEVIRRPDALSIKFPIHHASLNNIGVINPTDELELECDVSEECCGTIIYHPSAFGTSRVLLVIDNRESGNTRKLQQMCNLFHKKGIFYEMRSLSIGDYLWILRMCDGTEVVLDTIVERKTLQDLRSSIVQKRYEEQKQRLISTGISNIVYILEGSTVREDHVLEQALITTHIENRFLVYRTGSVEHTSLVLSKITERLMRKASKQELTGMSFENFQTISKKTPLRTVKDIFLRQLVICPQISIQKASVIIGRFPTFTALADFYASLPKEQRKAALSENFLGITKIASANMAKFYLEV